MSEPLRDLVALARHAAARDHFAGAGILQEPPHGLVTMAECEAPWCVGNRARIAAGEAAIEALLSALPGNPWVAVRNGRDCYACDAPEWRGDGTDGHADDCPWVAADAIRRGR